MSRGKSGSPRAQGEKQLRGRQSAVAQPHRPGILQPKMAAQAKRQPAAPPVYRPQPAPKCLQAKPASPAPRPSPAAPRLAAAQLKRVVASPQARPPRVSAQSPAHFNPPRASVVRGAVQLYKPTRAELKKDIPALRQDYINAKDPNDSQHYSEEFDVLVEMAANMEEIRQKVAAAVARKAAAKAAAILLPSPSGAAAGGGVKKPSPSPPPSAASLSPPSAAPPMSPPVMIGGGGGGGGGGDDGGGVAVAAAAVGPPAAMGGGGPKRKSKFKPAAKSSVKLDLGFKYAGPPPSAVSSAAAAIAPPQPSIYGALSGGALALAQTIEADRIAYNSGDPTPSPRYKGHSPGLTSELYNYGHNHLYSGADLAAVGAWWSGRSAAYEYAAAAPKLYEASHDVANFLFHHPTGVKSFNFHALKTGPKS